MRKILIGLLLLPALGIAQTESARQIVKQLCSPEFHGRGYVNGGDSIAAQFIRKEFEQIGCKFFKKKALQPFEFKVNTFPAEMNLVLNGTTLQPGVDFVVDPGSCGGRFENLKALVPEVDDVKSETSLIDFLKKHTDQIFAGKAVLVLDMPSYSKESREILVKQSAVLTSVLPVIEVTNTKFTWSVAGDQTQFPYFQVQKSAIHVSSDLTIDINVKAVLKNHTANNVIAYVPAKKKRSKKYFVYTAHYDHLGRMGQDAYFPGGNDNASGTAMLLELTRYFKANPLKDVNIVFMAFAGEEAGLYGSKYYTEHPLFPLNKISFLFNIDIMGSGEEGATVVNATVFPKEFEVLENINKEKNYLVKIGKRGEAANSDHYFFTKAGVPAFFLYTMGPNKHYHDVFDTYEELSFAEFDDLFHLLVDFGEDLPQKAQKSTK